MRRTVSGGRRHMPLRRYPGLGRPRVLKGSDRARSYPRPPDGMDPAVRSARAVASEAVSVAHSRIDTRWSPPVVDGSGDSATTCADARMLPPQRHAQDCVSVCGSPRERETPSRREAGGSRRDRRISGRREVTDVTRVRLWTSSVTGYSSRSQHEDSRCTTVPIACRTRVTAVCVR